MREEGRRYLYESRVSDFGRELEIDRDGLVVSYPDFWRRI
ncbi:MULTISPECIES: putative glycolipid-binding domain-containing protein [unclassified Mesorhizobium]|nr:MULTISPECIES: putative glycolipid-binding domain-containing protein [unclassified Mesorhizobium]